MKIFFSAPMSGNRLHYLFRSRGYHVKHHFCNVSFMNMILLSFMRVAFLLGFLTGSASAASFDGRALDQALRAHDWQVIGPALSEPGADRAAIEARDRWMSDHMHVDANFFLAMLLSRDEWSLAANMPDLSGDDLRRQSGIMALAAFALVVVDGEQCVDRSAPQHRIDQIIRQRASSLQHVRTLPEAERQSIIREVAALESSTAGQRDEGDLICRDGLSWFRAAQIYDSQRPAAQVHQGKTTIVQAPPGWQPELRARDLYGPIQVRDRARLTVTLRMLTGD